jgi:hypothetical protein
MACYGDNFTFFFKGNLMALLILWFMLFPRWQAGILEPEETTHRKQRLGSKGYRGVKHTLNIKEMLIDVS